MSLARVRFKSRVLFLHRDEESVLGFDSRASGRIAYSACRTGCGPIARFFSLSRFFVLSFFSFISFLFPHFMVISFFVSGEPRHGAADMGPATVVLPRLQRHTRHATPCRATNRVLISRPHSKLSLDCQLDTRFHDVMLEFG